MSYKNKILHTVFAAALITAVTAGTAAAQMNNRPYAFKNSPGGGVGMSIGGRQAIINEKLFRETPDNLQRGSGGFLVDVIEGPGHSAIVFQHGTTSALPGFHGSDFRGDNELMQAGAFNPYFIHGYNGSDLADYSYAQYQTAAMINSWTMSVVPGAGAYMGNNPVDSWTLFVTFLNK